MHTRERVRLARARFAPNIKRNTILLLNILLSTIDLQRSSAACVQHAAAVVIILLTVVIIIIINARVYIIFYGFATRHAADIVTQIIIIITLNLYVLCRYLYMIISNGDDDEAPRREEQQKL